MLSETYTPLPSPPQHQMETKVLQKGVEEMICLIKENTQRRKKRYVNPL